MSRGKIQVFDAVVDFSSTTIDATDWIQLGSAIGQNFVKVEYNDDTGSEFEIGYGAPAQAGPAYVAQRAFRTMPGGGKADQIFNSGMQMFIRLINGPGGATSLTSGRFVINGYY